MGLWVDLKSALVVRLGRLDISITAAKRSEALLVIPRSGWARPRLITFLNSR